MTPTAFVTLHDVAPAALDDCQAILETLRRRGIDRVTLLVVPGRDWSGAQIERLRGLQQAGHALAGHGWSHRAPDRRTAYHRLHAAVLSRDEAEHLSRSKDEARERVARCHAWFGEVGLEPPAFYVPPAWAIGPLSREDLEALPFRYYETLTGLYDADRQRFRVLPLVGYLADTPARSVTLRATNAVNRVAARALGRPLRIAIHPPDLGLRMADDLLRIAARPWRSIDAGWFGRRPGGIEATEPTGP